MTNVRWAVWCVVALAAVCSAARAGDFPEWRGPGRNGVVPDSPPLATTMPADGPARLWESEEVLGDQGGGFGCVGVAAGRAYVYTNRKYRVPIDVRTLSEQGLRQLGWTDRKPPEELVKLLEEVRVGEERAKLVGNPLNEWIKKWVEQNIPDEKDRKQFSPWVADRLQRGRKALPLDLLAKLETIKNREFADQAALDAWLAENSIDGDAKAAVLRVIPTSIEKAWDIVLCLDAATGRTLWKHQSDGKVLSWSASGTVCLAGGRCYVLASSGMLHCLDAGSGEEVWKVELAKGGGDLHSSVLVADGLVVAMASPLTAVDAATGEIKWKQPKVAGRENSPALWKHAEKTYLLCNTAKDVVCVELASGNIVWTAPGGGRCTAAVVGDHMAILSGREDVGLTAYRLSTTQPEKLWAKPDIRDGSASPIIHRDHVYAFGGNQVACVELASGKVAWQQKVEGVRETSPVLADGRILLVVDKGLAMIAASPEKFELLARAKMAVADFSSPAIADVRLYLRMKKAVACFDLTRSMADPVPER